MSRTNRKLAELLRDESFVRWVRGKASKKEQQIWEAWQKKDPLHSELKSDAELYYQMHLQMDDADDVEATLQELNNRIDQYEERVEQQAHVQSSSNRQKRGYLLSVAAAIALLVTMISVLYLYYPATAPSTQKESVATTVEVGFGEKNTLRFSDGSAIHLNSNSELKYKLDQFGGDHVEVWLQGEGYFDIAHNPGGVKREFIVHTNDGKVRVLGTKFNVNTRFQRTNVVLEEGRIEVSLEDSLYASISEEILSPGEQAVMAPSSREIVLQKVNVGIFTAWLNGEIEFDNTSLEEMIASIEAIYGVSLEVKEPKLLNRHITGRIQNPDLQNLLSGLQKILDLQIEQTDARRYVIMQQPNQNE